MKKFLTIPAAVAILTACTKTVTVYDDTEKEIGLSPVAEKASVSKAPVYGPQENNTYSTDEAFGIFAWHRVLGQQTSATWDEFSNGQTESGNGISLYINKGRFGYKAASSTGGSSLWAGMNADGTVHPYFWPKTGVLAFAGYSPYDAIAPANVSYSLFNGTDGAPGTKLTITGFTQGAYANTGALSATVTALTETNETVDVMWFDADDQNAVNLGAQNAANTGVGIVFRHACSWVDFKLQAASGAEGIYEILKVTLKNVYTKGSFDSSLAGDTFTNDGDEPSDITVGTGRPWTGLDYASATARDIVLYDQSAAGQTGTFLGTAAEGQTAATQAPVLELDDLIVIPQSMDATAANAEPYYAVTAKETAGTCLEIQYRQHTTPDGVTPNTETITQNLTASKDNYTGAEGTTDGEWLYGRHYVYTITFTVNEILIEPSMTGWTTENIPL